MKKLFFSFMALAMITLASCGGVDPVEFNNKLVSDQATILVDFQTLSNGLGAEDKAALKDSADVFTKKVDAKISEIKAMKTPKGGDELVVEVVNVFEMYKNVANKISEGASISEENVDEYNAFVDQFNKMLEEGDSLENKFIESQKEFAKIHNMEIR